MKTSPTNRLVSLAAVAAVALLSASAAVAAPKPGVPLFSDRAVAKLSGLPASAKTNSGLVGTLSPSALSAPALELMLADGQTVTARLQRVARDDRKATQSWIGTFDGAPGSVLILSKARGVITGIATYKDQTLELRPAGAGKHLLFTVDESKVPSGDEYEISAVGGGDALAAADYGTAGTTTATSGAVVHDVLILYTPAAATKWGQATLESMIQNAVQSANQAYQNSFVNVTMNVVGLQQYSIVESGMTSTLSALKSNSTVRSMRDRLAADMVLLVSQDGGYCGYSSLTWTTTSSGNVYDAYANINSGCLSQHTLAHEAGHLQRLEHNRENAGGFAMYAYSYGYRVCNVADGFRDIMSYACTSGTNPRILQFSNPNVYYNGYATGISYESNPASSAENARTLNNTAAMVAGYRVSTTSSSSGTVTPTVPAAPSSLVAKSVAYNAVALGWADNSADETGFKVQRSTDGVNFVEIASLGAGTVSFNDVTVAARTNYYYRVRAYNSVGGSNFSNTLSVTTPDVPPAPPAAPSNVAASNNGDGTALVSWTESTTSTTGFDVLREKWDSRKNVWTGSTVVASIPASYTSIVDSSGAGTYRYSVRAKNSGGASAYAGPANVTVTAPTNSKRRVK